jgi:hypothetical protein
MDRLTNLVTLLAAAIAVIAIALIGAPQDLTWLRNATGPVAWALSPYAAMWLLNNVIVAEQRTRDLVLLVTSLIMLGLESTHIALVLNGSAQASLAGTLQQLPVLQLWVVALGGLIALLLQWLRPGNKANQGKSSSSGTP